MRVATILWRSLLILIAVYVIVYLVNLPFASATPSPHFDVIAHRGVHHTFSTENLSNQTCTAKRIFPPTHDYIENTLPSMRAAFDAGATRIEIDVHRTADDDLVVFHDWTLDCRTEGQGETRRQTLAALQSLDVGFGYSADGGQSFPLRGKGVGAMPSLRQVLAAFPDGHFVIDQKDRDAATTALITAQLSEQAAAERVCLHARPERISQYLGAQPTGCTFASRLAIKTCLLEYLEVGWMGNVPISCRNQRLVVPAGGLSRLLWGWPCTFVSRLQAHGTRVHVFVPDARTAAHWRDLGFDGIWTDRVELR